MRQPSPSVNYVFRRLEWPPPPPRLAQPSSASSPSSRGTLGQTPVVHVRVYPPGGRRWRRRWGLVISHCCQLSDYAAIFSNLSLTFSRKATNRVTFSAAQRLLVTLSPVHKSDWSCVSNVMVEMVHLFLFMMALVAHMALVAGLDHKVSLKIKTCCPFSLQKQVLMLNTSKLFICLSHDLIPLPYSPTVPVLTRACPNEATTSFSHFADSLELLFLLGKLATLVIMSYFSPFL